MSALPVLEELQALLTEEVERQRRWMESDKFSEEPNYKDRVIRELGLIAGIKRCIEYIPKRDSD